MPSALRCQTSTAAFELGAHDAQASRREPEFPVHRACPSPKRRPRRMATHAIDPLRDRWAIVARAGASTSSGLSAPPRTGGGGPGDAGLCRPSDISMMEATDFGNLPYRPRLHPLDGPHVWRILLKREVSSRAVIVREVAGQAAAQMAFAKDEDMIQTLAPDRADKPLGEGILPWAVRRGQHFPDPRALHSVP